MFGSRASLSKLKSWSLCQVMNNILMVKRPFGKIVFVISLSLTRAEGVTMKQALTNILAVLLISTVVGCAGGSLTTREKGAGIGALGGAAAGGIIGAAVGHPGAGAAIGGALGLGAGALVGDQLQGQEQKQADQQRQIESNQSELDRQKQELERLKQQGEY
jgi:phage tail tape-measure protein